MIHTTRYTWYNYHGIPLLLTCTRFSQSMWRLVPNFFFGNPGGACTHLYTWRMRTCRVDEKTSRPFKFRGREILCDPRVCFDRKVRTTPETYYCYYISIRIVCPRLNNDIDISYYIVTYNIRWVSINSRIIPPSISRGTSQNVYFNAVF